MFGINKILFAGYVFNRYNIFGRWEAHKGDDKSISETKSENGEKANVKGEVKRQRKSQ